MIRSVQAGGGAKANAFARAGEPLRIDQSIQLGHLRRPQDVVDHQIALKIEKVLLQLLVRSVHGHTLLCLVGPGVNANMSAPASARPERGGDCSGATATRLRGGPRRVETIREERDE